MLLIGKKQLKCRVSRSMKLKGCLIAGWFVVNGNIWLNGRAMVIMKISGLKLLIWAMLRMPSLSIRLSPFLGSQGPGGGVVLGSEIDFQHYLGKYYDL